MAQNMLNLLTKDRCRIRAWREGLDRERIRKMAGANRMRSTGNNKEGGEANELS